MAKSTDPINVVCYYPKTEKGKCELAKRVAAVHALTVYQHINNMNCPPHQKVDMINALIRLISESGRCDKSAKLQDYCRYNGSNHVTIMRGKLT